MATHSGILAWEIPWREGHDLATKQQHRNTQRILPVIVLQEITTISQLFFFFTLIIKTVQF